MFAVVSRTAPKVAIVVPCFNEAARLPVDEFVSFGEKTGVRFVFSNDGSTDETDRVLGDLVARTKGRSEKITLERNSGKAEAVRRGLLRALESDAEVVGYFDADLATPLDEVPRMVAYFEDPDVLAVTGARVQLHGGRIERRPLRHYAGRVFATAATLALKTTYYDTQCGAKLFRRGPVFAEAISEPFSSAWIFDVELLGRLMIGAARLPGGPTTVREHPLYRWRDVGGSKVRASTFLRAPFELLRLSMELRRWEARQ
ncbi:MAG TPA: glycosyltransferase [Labilithrix sp.]|nr:glycosyltransferase [Labilithrix sp.]